MPFSIQDVRGAVARGWCSPENSGKEMDGALAEAIAMEIWALLHLSPPYDKLASQTND